MGGMDDRQTGHAMSIDDAYVVERRLAHGVNGATELVTLDGMGPFVRKRMPSAEAHRMVWAALSECSCPYLPRVQATYEMPDEFVAVYDYVPGETLGRVVEQRSHLTLAEVAPVMVNLCDAAAVLHAHGVVHADIAPANVVLAKDGAHLIDFGIARMTFEKPARDEKAWGTRGFAAPEQHGFAAIDTRSDIYALGRLAGFLLTGTHLAEKTYEAELRCSGLVPEAVCRVLGRACAFEPSARYQTVEEFAGAFAAAAADGGETGSRAAKTPAPAGNAPDAGTLPRGSKATGPSSGDDAPVESADVSTASKPALHAERERAQQEAGRLAALHVTSRTRRAIVAMVAVLAFAAGATGIWLAVTHASDRDDQAPQSASNDALDDSSSNRGTSSGLLSGAGDGFLDQEPNAGLIDQAVEDLAITESSWYVSSSGYVYYVVAIKNTGDSVLALFPKVTITGRDAGGTVVFSDEQVLNELYPGETRYWGSIAGNGTEEPATVEFALGRPGDWEVEAAHGEPTRFSVSDIATSRDEFGSLHVTGEITLDALGDEFAQSQIQLVAIGRDAQGKLAFGFEGYATLPAEGDTVPFEFESMDTKLPSYETVDVYAYVW